MTNKYLIKQQLLISYDQPNGKHGLLWPLLNATIFFGILTKKEEAKIFVPQPVAHNIKQQLASKQNCSKLATMQQRPENEQKLTTPKHENVFKEIKY